MDIAKLRERLAATIERAKADDPRELRKRITERERELRARLAPAKVETIVERVEIPVLQDGQIKRLEQTVAELANVGGQLVTIAQELGAALARAAVQPTPSPTPVRPPRPTNSGSLPAPVPTPMISPTTPVDRLSAPQQRILDTLSSFEAVGLNVVARSNIAVWSD